METNVKMEAIYAPSEDIVAREIEGEMIIVPLVSGMGDMEDDLFTMNETGRAIWSRLDGTRSLREVIRDLAEAFEASPADIERDVTGFVIEILKRKIIVERPPR